MTDRDPDETAKAKPISARDQRLAKALRDNLRRRKAAPSADRDPSSPHPVAPGGADDGE